MNRKVIGKLIFIGMATNAVAASPVAIEADRELKKSSTCSVDGLGPIIALITKYETSADPDVRLVVAKARLQAGFVYWFRQEPSHRQRLAEVIRLYDNDPDPKVSAIAADARLMAAMSERDQSRKAILIEPIIDHYVHRPAVEYAEVYYKALFAMSDVSRIRGDKDEADRLHAKGQQIYLSVVRPNARKADDQDAEICV